MKRFQYFTLLALLLTSCAVSRGQTESPPAADHQSAEAVVNELYDLVTFKAGTTPDWDKVRALFIDQAVIVLRTAREETTVFSVDGFVQDFVDFIGRANVEKTGFTERIVRTRMMVMGDIAHALVLYEAHIPGTRMRPQQGVDSFHLIRRDGRWWIASIINELPGEGRPAPEELRE